MKFVIPFHSFIDVITNSSTEIYVTCHSKTKDMVFDMIDSILKEGGSDKKARDLFEIKMYRTNYIKDEESWDEEEVEIGFNTDGSRADEYEEEDNWDRPEDHAIVVLSKEDGKEVKAVTSALHGIFESEAHNG